AAFAAFCRASSRDFAAWAFCKRCALLFGRGGFGTGGRGGLGRAWASRPNAARNAKRSVRMRSIMEKRPLGRPQCGRKLTVGWKKAKGELCKLCDEWKAGILR